MGSFLRQSVSAIALLGATTAPVFGVVSSTNFDVDAGDWSTPLASQIQPGDADWTRRASGATPSSSTGPAGGANPSTRAVEVSGNGYLHTEASAPNEAATTFTQQGPQLNASLGTFTLTYDLHMRHGSEGGQNNGNLRVQGFNGTSWQDIGPVISGSQQTSDTAAYLPSADFGAVTSSGFSNTDFRFRFLATRTAAGSPNFDNAVDNVVITGPGAAVAPPVDLRASLFNSGGRRLHVSLTGSQPADGTVLPGGQIFTTSQAGLNALQAGDVMTIAPGDYFERPSRSDIPGAVGNPVWIAAETPGTVRILDVKTAAFNGAQSWTLENGSTGRYSAAIGDAYTGTHDGQFLPKYSSTGVLDAGSVDGRSKPSRGMAFSDGRLHIRLSGNQNPNGQEIILTADDDRSVMDLGSSDNVIVDGIEFVGGGENAPLRFDQGAANPVIRNCQSGYSRFLVQVGSDAIVEWNDYRLEGAAQWMRDVQSQNSNTRRAHFDIIKGDLAQGGNALYEGGIARGAGGFQTGAVHSNAEFRFNRYFGVFDGERFGEWRDSISHHNVGLECGDDFQQFEDDRNSNHGINNRSFFNRIRDNRGPIFSHQNSGAATHEVIRNIVEYTGSGIIGHEFLIKTIRTQPGSTIRYAHNYFEHNGNAGNVGSPSSRSPWYPFSTPVNSGGDEIDVFLNNIVAFEGDSSPTLPQAAGSPGDADGNAWVGPTSEPSIQGPNGTFAGTSRGNLDLAADLTLLASSPARNIGQPLPGGFEDPITGANANDDAGPFPFGFDPGTDFPRPFGLTFDIENAPPRWPFS